MNKRDIALSITSLLGVAAYLLAHIKIIDPEWKCVAIILILIDVLSRIIIKVHRIAKIKFESLSTKRGHMN